MNFRQVAMVVTWLGIGLAVVAVSLWQGHKQTVWGREQTENEVLISEIMGLELPKELALLPEGTWLPGEWGYPLEMVHDWLWWRLADSDVEEQRRLIYLAHERLHAGWLLCEKGEFESCLVTLTKAESYLQAAAGTPPVVVTPVVQEAAKIHYLLLGKLELQMPEVLRPRVTELLNVSRSLVADSI